MQSTFSSLRDELEARGGREMHEVPLWDFLYDEECRPDGPFRPYSRLFEDKECASASTLAALRPVLTKHPRHGQSYGANHRSRAEAPGRD